MREITRSRFASSGSSFFSVTIFSSRLLSILNSLRPCSKVDAEHVLVLHRSRAVVGVNLHDIVGALALRLEDLERLVGVAGAIMPSETSRLSSSAVSLSQGSERATQSP